MGRHAPPLRRHSYESLYTVMFAEAGGETTVTVVAAM